MNNEALVLADVTCGDSEKVITFIQSKTKGLKGEEHEILDTFPILYVKNPGEDICKELKQFISEELTFENGINPAGQPYEEILELLDTTDVYVCDNACADELCSALKEKGFSSHKL